MGASRSKVVHDVVAHASDVHVREVVSCPNDVRKKRKELLRLGHVVYSKEVLLTGMLRQKLSLGPDSPFCLLSPASAR